MDQKPMVLRLNAPAENGLVKVQGTELLTPDGSVVTSIRSIRIALEPGEVMVTTVELTGVVVEHRSQANPE